MPLRKKIYLNGKEVIIIFFIIFKIGQVCFGIYISAQMVTRVTVSLAFFSTAEMPKQGDEKAPAITLLPASILCIVIFVIHFFAIGIFKVLTIKEFRKISASSSIEDKLVHVLANTLVSHFL